MFKQLFLKLLVNTYIKLLVNTNREGLKKKTQLYRRHVPLISYTPPHPPLSPFLIFYTFLKHFQFCLLPLRTAAVLPLQEKKKF